MLVRENPTQEWGNFYDEIIGFTWEEGYHFTLSVLRRPVHNPPADGSSLEYSLIQVLSRIAVTAAAPQTDLP